MKNDARGSTHPARPRRRLPFRGTLLCALALAILPAAAQDGTRFKPYRDLEGFEECQFSEYTDLYDFKPFEGREGEDVSKAELERIREAWRAERVRVLREIERIETDPRAGREYRLGRQLRQHPYFSNVALEQVGGHDPFLFVVQETLEAGADAPARVAAAYGPWLEALARAFEDEFVQPLELSRREGFELLPVVVLASRGNFDDYLRVAWNSQNPAIVARYEKDLRLLVLHRDRFGAPGASPERRRHDDLREAALFLLHAHNSTADSLPAPFWFGYGLADYLAGNDGRDPASLRSHPFTPDLLLFLVDLLRKDAERRVYWLSPRELLQVGSWEDAGSRAKVRAQAESASKFSPDSAGLAARIESMAFVHYLLHGEGGRRRARFLEGTKAALTRSGRANPFDQLFAGEALAEVEAGFVRHLWAEHRRLRPGIELADAELERVLRSFKSEAQATPPSEPSADPDPALRAPLVDELGPEARLALAIARVRRGDAESAAGVLEKLAAGGADPLAQRAGRELERVRAWIALRDRFLAHVAGSKNKLSLEHPGGELVAAVARVEDGVVTFEQNASRIDSLPVASLESLELAKEMGARKHGFAADWARAYPYLLAGMSTWKSLAGEGLPAAALREDAGRDYPALLLGADAAGRIEALDQLEDLRDPASARTALEDVRALWSESSGLDFVAALRPRLAELARAALKQLFVEDGLASALNGELEHLAGGAIRMRYDFGDEAELADFPIVEQKLYPVGGEVPASAVDAQSEWRSGRLAMRGDSARRHLLEFEGPMRLAYTWQGVNAGGDPQHIYFLVGLCAGRSSYAGCLNGFTLDLFDKRKGVFHRAPEDDPRTFFVGTDYAVELVHDGESSLRLECDGESRASVPCGELRSGGVLLFLRSDLAFLFDDLVIEGRPTAASLALLCGSWTEARLAELGLAGD